MLRRLAPAHPFVVPFDGDLRIRLRPIDRFGKAIYVSASNSDPHLAALLDAYLAPAMTYFDVGAHIGQFTLMAAKRVGPTGAVHSFEASSSTYEHLVCNIAINEFPWVRSTHAAVCDHEGSVQLNTCTPGKEAFNSIGRPLRPDDQVTGQESVDAVTLDAYCDRAGVQHIDLMKIDVEGAELMALRGAGRVLGAADAPPLVLEFSDETARRMGSTTHALRGELESLGYQLFSFDLESRRLNPWSPDQADPATVNIVAAKDPQAFHRVIDRSSPAIQQGVS